MKDFSVMLDGSSYDDKINNLDKEYNEIIDKIDDIVSYDIDSDNFSYIRKLRFLYRIRQ